MGRDVAGCQAGGVGGLHRFGAKGFESWRISKVKTNFHRIGIFDRCIHRMRCYHPFCFLEYLHGRCSKLKFSAHSVLEKYFSRTSLLLSTSSLFQIKDALSRPVENLLVRTESQVTHDGCAQCLHWKIFICNFDWS